MGASEPRYVSETYRWLLSKDPTMALFPQVLRNAGEMGRG